MDAMDAMGFVSSTRTARPAGAYGFGPRRRAVRQFEFAHAHFQMELKLVVEIARETTAKRKSRRTPAGSLGDAITTAERSPETAEASRFHVAVSAHSSFRRRGVNEQYFVRGKNLSSMAWHRQESPERRTGGDADAVPLEPTLEFRCRAFYVSLLAAG